MAIPQSPKPAQELELLRKKHTELDRKKTVAQTQLESATRNLEELKAQARKLYGTDDLPELRRKLEEMRQSNQQKLTEYQKHLEQVEAGLAEVEKQYSQGK